MIKNLLLLLLLPCSAWAQDYQFSVQKSTYERIPKEKRTVISPSSAWNWIPKRAVLPFDCQIMGTGNDSLDCDYQGISFYSPDRKTNVSIDLCIFPNNNIVDRNYDKDNPGGKPAISTVAYFISGPVGSRIAKIEFENVKFSNSGPDDSLCYQFWYYEGSEDIEMHFGPSVVKTSKKTLTGGNIAAPGYRCGINLYDIIKQSTIKEIYLAGTTDQPVAQQTVDNAFVDEFPNEGIVYRFQKTTTRIAEQPKVKSLYLEVYPNPATDRLSIDLQSSDPFQAQVYDLSGRILENKVFTRGEQQDLDIRSLAKGFYLLRVLNLQTQEQHVLSFIKQ